MGHGDLECANPAQRNALGKLPYDVLLRAPKEKKKRIQGLAQAAAESFGSTSSLNPRQSHRSTPREGKSTSSTSDANGAGINDKEVLSPLKRKEPEADHGLKTTSSHVGQNLFPGEELVLPRQNVVKKRKAKRQTAGVITPDTIGATGGGVLLVPIGTVQARLSELAGTREGKGKDSEELPKKQRVSPDAKTAAAAEGSPRRAQ